MYDSKRTTSNISYHNLAAKVQLIFELTNGLQKNSNKMCCCYRRGRIGCERHAAEHYDERHASSTSLRGQPQTGSLRTMIISASQSFGRLAAHGQDHKAVSGYQCPSKGKEFESSDTH